ncbi:MAG TPA: MerR family transcriptional regulator [Caldilineaceae bacterium]|nr:MerR family transcriptional regulator [Caldilineaceae bacterium]
MTNRNDPRPDDNGYSFAEVAQHLQVDQATLREWNRRFAQFLIADVTSDTPLYTVADVAALVTVQKLLEQGFNDEQVIQFLTPKRIEVVKPEPAPLAVSSDETTTFLPQVVGDVLSTIANSQQTVLNSQATVREMVGVVVQDNFNLKDENRKLRDRMLELERALAEYQRREETRKERLESRVRGLENVVTALQQQVAQLVQIQRQRRRGWFG